MNTEDQTSNEQTEKKSAMIVSLTDKKSKPQKAEKPENIGKAHLRLGRGTPPFRLFEEEGNAG